jgi:histidinol-phosphate aminotransferase
MTAKLTDIVAGLPASSPFIGPETLERRMGLKFAVRLGANEQRFGPSPLAVAAMAGQDAWMYGDPETYDLKQALAAKHGCRAENIVVGEGVDGLLGLIVRLFIGAGDSVVTSKGSYPTFNYHVSGFGGLIRAVPYVNDHSDPAGLIAASDGAKLVYIANPDNPMGSHHSAAVILQMLSALPEGSLLVLDEAYIDFAPDAPVIDADDPRLIRLRSFSKSYGLAGLRLGYAICAPELAIKFDLVRHHFGVGRMVQAAGLAALSYHAHLAQVLAGSVAARAQIAQIAGRFGLRALPSATNFTCVDLGRDGDYARAVLARLLELGVFVRMPSTAPMDRCLRISHGTAQDLEIFEQALAKAL